jgi:hypothetical protein
MFHLRRAERSDARDASMNPVRLGLIAVSSAPVSADKPCPHGGGAPGSVTKDRISTWFCRRLQERGEPPTRRIVLLALPESKDIALGCRRAYLHGSPGGTQTSSP